MLRDRGDTDTDARGVELQTGHETCEQGHASRDRHAHTSKLFNMPMAWA